MADLNIDLSEHTDKYTANSLQLAISKKVNFIYGKNGTGKTTIADTIAEQFADDYSVHVFKDFDGVAINERLDAVALGTENAEIQRQIDVVDSDITSINKEIEKPEDDTENIFTKAALAKKAYNYQDKKIEDFYIKSAQQIKNLNNPSIASPNYDKNAFKSEIVNSKPLSDKEVLANKDTIKADKKSDITSVTFPVIGLSSYLKLTNEILEASIKQPTSISELDNKPEKQQFAKTGLGLHEHKQGEICAFCGNEISGDRWILLGNYFSSEVKTLEHRIENAVKNIKNEVTKLDTVNSIDEHKFYGKYAEQIKQLNIDIKLRKAEYKAYLSNLQKSLDEKSINLFVKTATLALDAPEDFTGVQKDYDSLVNENSTFSKNLTNEQNTAKSILRFHEIQKKLEDFKYPDENASLATLYELDNVAQEDLQNKKDDLAAKQQERIDLISKTKDEEKIAVKISELLKDMGFSSFELKLVTDEDENQKGQYRIKGHNGNIRPITALSKGEKNIIALLYFIFDLGRADGNSKPKLVVLDDPMTSNDDTMQYIMIGEIQKFYRNLKDGNCFLLLTHNVHFYLNVRPNTAIKYKVGGEEISFYKKFGVYQLFSDAKRTTIKTIENGKDDFSTSYETLWKELVFLYQAANATPDLMLNPCRKICETYMNFTKKGIEAFYGENTNAKKLFDVNHHSIDDLEAEQNGKTKDEIKDIIKGLFGQNGAEEHFDNYWKESES